MPQYDRGKVGKNAVALTSVLTSNFTPTTPATYEDTGLTIDLTTNDNEYAHIVLNGSVYAGTGDYLQFFLRILVDGVAVKEMYWFVGTTTVNGRLPVNLTLYHPFSAGSHTVKVQMKYQTAGELAIFQGGNETNDQRGTLQVVQFGV